MKLKKKTSCRSSCKCDENFYNCLKTVKNHSDDAKTIGELFFNRNDTHCFEQFEISTTKKNSILENEYSSDNKSTQYRFRKIKTY